MSLLVFATITAKPGLGEELKAAFLDLIPQVRAEAACQLYELYVSMENPDQLIMHELWDNEAGLAAHAAMPHMDAFKQQFGSLMAGPAILTSVQQ
ncbi:putative quinol monooxygenase [Fibrella forsythiae]|uniref:Antibiotic biosynthesis monooxygenase n=1 Tax=Fibrella forsythiae TaxID=2817061 RepID=A0ABS3JFA5_9BACT|nr:putative quinol monooxygenase [Fibrella forsythiae]MBO0948667.1 antibiotic biosynthesis monooxygenase [Fibrella forsythiae]